MTTNPADTGYAPDRWEFDQEVSRVFDDMLARSIPQYETMREAVTLVASGFLSGSSPKVLDLGCSRGESLAGLVDLERAGDARFWGLEVSQPMLEAANDRFARDLRVTILEHDLRKPLRQAVAVIKFDVVMSVLTLMFVPINHRLRLLCEVYDRLKPGGALVVVEKVLGEMPKVDDLFNANYHRKKVDSGYTPDEVERKRLSLEGVLVPMTGSWNVDMVRRAGFREVDCFWRWMNFGGWVAVK